MKAVILAAGRGSRLGGLTDDCPKALVKIAGIPLLDRQINALNAAGIDDVTIVTGYRNEMISKRPTAAIHNPHWAQSNMVRSLLCARHCLESSPCVVSYSDIFYKPQAVAALMQATADIAITYDPDWRALWSRRFAEPLSDAETFRTDADGFLTEIGARPTSFDQVQGQYMGLLRFTPTGWGKVTALIDAMTEAQVDRLDMTGLLRLVMTQSCAVQTVPSPWPWGEVDDPEDLALYEENADSFGLNEDVLP